MHDILPLHVKVSLKNLPKDLHNFAIGQSIRMFLQIIGKSPALQMLHYKVNMMILEYNIIQSDYIFMPRILQLPQVTQSCYLATQKISGYFIVNCLKIDRLDSHLSSQMISLQT